MKRILGLLAFIVMSVMVFGYLSAPAWAQRPALTRDVDNGDRQSIIIGPETLTIELVDGHAIDSDCYPTNVPAGKRWIIDHLSAVATLPSSQVPVAYFYTFNTHGRMYIPFTYQGGPISSHYYWVGNLPIMLRLSAGDTLCAVFFREGPDNAEGKIIFSGYQIDAP